MDVETVIDVVAKNCKDKERRDGIKRDVMV